MGHQFAFIEPEHRKLIDGSHVFFTASAVASGRVNVSPRSTQALRVLDPATVAYLDLTGSGNETAAHIRAGGRLTLMFCAFEGPPAILRLYGTGTILARRSKEYLDRLDLSFDGVEPVGARQMVIIAIDLVQLSCGYGVPLMHFAGERTTLTRWAEHKGEVELERYRREKNATSLDGLPAGNDAEPAPALR